MNTNTADTNDRLSIAALALALAAANAGFLLTLGHYTNVLERLF